ncbi:related to mRNA transport regulator MTR2 [Saccharomycodes ludwigii]|uniref:Related to mRNA transport regulator MTR2 n=1 Tax=Saccharomycodes ludwigii TaxID=36035 RepID=A0A376B330_9ASCO|nr:hypothetical protein SCDLUD_004290 [Saccharomycodes ludwigii]KAH3899974.1 hypothetical protein SCDLUD_004290 [Saccharomycodes ludwigii]SSD59098.1 related to mRNA transport regulator MTR2 [Saccharomycodes ludwigii]
MLHTSFNNPGSNNPGPNNNNDQSGFIELFVKKILLHLDETDQSKLNDFYLLFDHTSPNTKIIFNSQPFDNNHVIEFIKMWNTSIVTTQHVLTSLDYHIIPGLGFIICNVNGKVRFDESGNDRLGNNSVITTAQQPINNSLTSTTTVKKRPLWGPYFGVSLQIMLQERILNNDLNNVISGFNYSIVYQPKDSLLVEH